MRRPRAGARTHVQSARRSFNEAVKMMDEFALLVADFEAPPASLQHCSAPTTARVVSVRAAVAKEDALWRELPTATQVASADEESLAPGRSPRNRAAKRDVAAAVATLRRARAEAEVARIVEARNEAGARARAPSGSPARAFATGSGWSCVSQAISCETLSPRSIAHCAARATVAAAPSRCLQLRVRRCCARGADEERA